MAAAKYLKNSSGNIVEQAGTTAATADAIPCLDSNTDRSRWPRCRRASGR